MEGTKKIQEKILADADREIEKIMEEAKSQIDEIKKEGRNKIELIKKKSGKDIQHEIKLYEDRVLAQKRMEVNRDYLKTREDIVNSFIERAIDNIDSLAEYEDFLENIIKRNKDFLGKDVKLFCNEKDKNKVKKILEKLKLHFDIRESEIKAGIILEDDAGKRINESLQSVLELRRNELRKKIIEMME